MWRSLSSMSIIGFIHLTIAIQPSIISGRPHIWLKSEKASKLRRFSQSSFNSEFGKTVFRRESSWQLVRRKIRKIWKFFLANFRKRCGKFRENIGYICRKRNVLTNLKKSCLLLWMNVGSFVHGEYKVRISAPTPLKQAPV